MASFFLSKTKPPFYFERPSMRFLTADFPEKNTYVFNSNNESYIHIHRQTVIVWRKWNWIEFFFSFTLQISSIRDFIIQHGCCRQKAWKWPDVWFMRRFLCFSGTNNIVLINITAHLFSTVWYFFNSIFWVCYMYLKKLSEDIRISSRG